MADEITAPNPSLVTPPSAGDTSIPSTSLTNPSDQTGDPFITPEEGGSAAGENPATPEANNPQQTSQTPAENGEVPPALDLATIKSKEADQLDENEKKFLQEHVAELTPEEQTKYGVQPVEPKLFADKFKTEADLRAAYATLGGDPNKYDTPEKLEEAYLVRQAEYTRSRQELAERNRVEPTNTTPTPEELTSKIIGSMDFSKINDAKDLATQLLGAIMQNAPEPGKQLSEEEMAAKLMPVIQQREARAKELSEIEDEVPRLKIVRDANGVAIPNPFRDAFATYVAGQKQQGQYKSMKESMKTFLGVAQPSVQAIEEQKKREAAIKNANTPTPDPGQALPPKPTEEDDIVGGIIDAQKEHKGKFGY